MSSYGFFSADRAREISRNDRVRNQQPINASQERSPPIVPPFGRIPFYNGTGGQIPGCSIMAVTSWSAFDDGQLYANVAQPSTTFYPTYLLSPLLPTAAGDMDSAQTGPKFLVAYDSGTPALGEGWGPKPGQWTASKGFPCTTLVDKVYDSTNLILQGSFGPITSLLGKASGAITARSGTTPGTGTMAIWYDNGGTLTDTTMTVTVKNISQTAVTASAYIQAKWIGSAWWVDVEDCAP